MARKSSCLPAFLRVFPPLPPAKNIGKCSNLHRGIAGFRFDRLESPGGNQPGTGTLRHAIPRPALQRRGKRIVHRILRQIEITQQPNERGQNPPGLRPIKRLQTFADFSVSRHRRTVLADPPGIQSEILRGFIASSRLTSPTRPRFTAESLEELPPSLALGKRCWQRRKNSFPLRCCHADAN